MRTNGLRERAVENCREIESIWNKADDEGRGLSRRERARVEELIDETKSARNRIEEAEGIDRQMAEIFGAGPTEVKMSDPNAAVGDGWSGSGSRSTRRPARRRPSSRSTG